jgi:succinate dehydrogenase / fumarate reductase membrane anchor subunit
MRFSGVLLVVLIFGHLFVNLFLGEGVKAIDWAFVAGKLANPFWIVWDMLLLWLALIHGSNGMRTIINDYARGKFRVVLLVALAGATIVLLTLGTLVLTTFDPCLAGTPADLLPDFCAAQ